MTEIAEKDFSNPQENLPVFRGDTYESHTQAWMDVSEEVEGRRWQLAAIAASLVKSYGENVTGTFAADVGVAASTVRYYAQTYRVFENANRLVFLGFTHHGIAARSEDPQKAIEEAADKLLSKRQMEVRVEAEALPLEERHRVIRAAEERRLSGEDARRLVRARIEKREKERERERTAERTPEEVVGDDTSAERPNSEELEQGRQILEQALEAEVQGEIEEILEVCAHCGAPSSAWERRPE